MHRAVMLLGAVGAIGCAWQLYAGSRYSVEMAIGATVATTAYAVWRYMRLPSRSTPSTHG